MQRYQLKKGRVQYSDLARMVGGGKAADADDIELVLDLEDTEEAKIVVNRMRAHLNNIDDAIAEKEQTQKTVKTSIRPSTKKNTKKPKIRAKTATVETREQDDEELNDSELISFVHDGGVDVTGNFAVDGISDEEQEHTI